MNGRLMLLALLSSVVVLVAAVGPHPTGPRGATEGAWEAAEPCFPEGWTVLGSGTWSCDGSTIVGHTSSGDSMLVSPDTFSDFELSADVSTLNREASLAFRVQDQSNAYTLIFEPDGIPPFPGGIWFARRVPGSETYPFYSHPDPFPTAGEVAHLRIVGQGSIFEVELNGVSLGTVEDSTFSSGKLGLRIYGDAGLPDDARFSNVVATDTTSPTPEPTTPTPAPTTPTPAPGPAPHPAPTPTPCGQIPEARPCGKGETGLNTCELRAGDIVLTHEVSPLYAAENLLFKGYWTHAGIYNGDGTFTEAVPSGVRIVALEDSSFNEPSDWAVLRTNRDGNVQEKAVSYAREQHCKPYNWNYLDKDTEDSFYCSQLVWRAYQKQGIDLDATGWVPAVPPDDIYFDGDVTIVKQRPGIGASLRRFLLRILSPADLYLTDPEGRHTGVDPSTGEVVEQIPGVFYSGPDADPEFMSIEDLDGAWRIQVVGTGDGPYTLQAEAIDADNHQVAEATGETAEGLTATYEVGYPEAPGESIRLTPTSLPEELVAGWNQPCYLGTEQPIELALAGIIADVQAVYRLNSGQTFDRWFPDRPEVSNITTIRPYEPLFVLMAKDSTWPQTPSGTPPDSVSLVQGWNNVCYAGTAKTPEDATSGIADELAILYTLGSDQAWGHYVPGRPEASNIPQLNQYDSVLVLVTQEGGATWAFNP